MPRQLLLSRVPVDLSLVEFNLDEGEDVFLTYTWERREGPIIQRTGISAPSMHRIGGSGTDMTSHPFGLRLGTWLIQDEMRQKEIEEARQELALAQRNRLPHGVTAILEETITELQTIKAHDKVFEEFYPGYEIIGIQGCGDLTMNLWNVACVNNDLGKDPPDLVCSREEPLDYRTYSCLVKWKASRSGQGRVTIEEVRFRHQMVHSDTNQRVLVRFGDEWLPRGDLIDFAVSNQQVIRDGEIVPIVTTSHQFGDLRHLIQMPNLNPAAPLYPGEPGRNGRYRPRNYFGLPQMEDIWMGEEAFIKDHPQNLLRAALSGPIFLDFPAGSDEHRLRGALNRTGYREAASALASLSPGDWRFVRRNHGIVLEVYFKRNTYGWTMVGLSSDNRRILCMACTGRAGQTGYTLEKAAKILLRAGAYNALLIDEGNDVFQRVRWDGGRLVDMVPLQRRRLRAIFLFGRPRYGFGCRPSPPAQEDAKYAPR